MTAAVEVLFNGNAAGAIAAAEETSAALKSVGETSAVSSGEMGKLERGAIAGSGALSGMGRSIAFASAAFLGAAGLTGAIKGAVDQSEELEKATESARVALERQGADVGKLIPQYQATAKAAADYGVSEADAMQGLARATLLTGSARKAQIAYNDALVISKATGKDLSNTLIATSKAQDGSTTSLARYGIMLPKVTTAQDALKNSKKQATAAEIAHAKAIDTEASATEASRIIMQRFGGQAAANTTNLDRLRANAANLGAELGGPLLAVLNAVAGALSVTVGWIQRNKAVLEPLAAVIGIATAALGVFFGVVVGIPAALAAVSAGLEFMSATLLGLPIGWVVLALAALAVGLTQLWEHSQTFRDIVTGTWHDIESAARTVWGAVGGIVRGAMRLIEDVIRVAMALIHGDWSGAWNAIKQLAGDALHAIEALLRGAVHLLGSLARSIGTAIYNGILQPIGHLLGQLASTVRGAISSAIHTVAGWAVGAAAAIGSAITHGILSGIGGLAGSLVSKLKGAAGGALGAVKGFLHIGSPSRRFADEVGEPIAQGIIAGFLRGIAPFSDVLASSLTPSSISSSSAATPALTVAPGAAALAGQYASPGGASYFPNARFQVIGTTSRQVAQGVAQIVRDAPRTPSIAVVAR